MQKRQNLNVLIIGGGPAGMSCALWLKNYGLNPVIVEKDKNLGGLQAKSLASNTWLLGWQSVLGKDVAATFSKHVAYERIQTMLSSQIISITKLSETEWQATLLRAEEGARPKNITLIVRAIVIATGTDFVGQKWIKSIPGAEKCKNLIHMGPASYMNPNSWFGDHPVIVGGGDNALECASILSRRGSHPILLVRSEHFRADQDSQGKFKDLVQTGLVDLHMETEITNISMQDDEKIKIETNNNQTISSDSILLMLGYSANSSATIEFFGNPCPVRDENNYFVVDGNCETSIPSVYAIGDVANPRHPCTATAVAMGTMAARHINNCRGK